MCVWCIIVCKYDIMHIACYSYYRTTVQEQWNEGHTHSTTTWSEDREWRYTAAHHRGTHLTSPSLAFLQTQPCPVSNLVAFSQMQQLALLDLGYDTRFGNMGSRIVLKNRMSCEETSMEPQNHITMLNHPVTSCNPTALNVFTDSDHWTLQW